MKVKLQRIQTSPKGIVIQVLPPNEVSDSKNAKIVKGLRDMLEEFNYIENAAFAQNYRDFTGLILERNPFNMAQEFLNILSANSGEGTRSYLLCEALSKFPKADFIRWADANWLKDVSRAWFSDSGLGIDVQADVISEAYGQDIQIQDIIDHVVTYKPGEYKKPLQQDLERITSRFRDLYGFNLTPGYARFLVKREDKDSDLPF